jgi:hypothetical protein
MKDDICSRLGALRIAIRKIKLSGSFEWILPLYLDTYPSVHKVQAEAATSRHLSCFNVNSSWAALKLPKARSWKVKMKLLL